MNTRLKFAFAGRWVTKTRQANKILRRAMGIPDHYYRIPAAISIRHQLLANGQ